MTNPFEEVTFADNDDFCFDCMTKVDEQGLCDCGDEYEHDDDCDDCDDGQPTEYEEWQDVYGGDDWDHGQYDNGWD